MKNSKRVIGNNGKIEMHKEDFNKEFAAEIEYQKDGRVNWDKFRKALLKYDSQYKRTLHTKRRKGPWQLIYFETFPTRSLAMKREKYLKNRKGT
ncbi:hypothetical protein GF373_13905 [bacterium]|nr:hypothetical protein [bacterium]